MEKVLLVYHYRLPGNQHLGIYNRIQSVEKEVGLDKQVWGWKVRPTKTSRGFECKHFQLRHNQMGYLMQKIGRYMCIKNNLSKQMDARTSKSAVRTVEITKD